jgi:transcriptional regulator with XRE-family HTH domain
MSLATRLNKLRKERGITKYKLAKDLGVPVSTVRSWINSDINPREPNIEKLAKYFGVHPAWLRYGVEEYSSELKEGLLRVANKIKQFAEKHPECLSYLEKAIELFINDWEKAAAQGISWKL